MDANWTNGNDSSDIVDFGELPGFVAYNLIMLLGILVPVVILDVLLLTALFLDKVTPIQIRTAIISLLLGALGVSFALALEHITALVLSTTNHPVPSVQLCHFIVWVMGGAGGVRMIFTAVFSIIVYISVKKSAKAVNQYVLIVCSIVLWIASFAVSTPLLSAFIVGTQFLGQTACLPRATQETHPRAFMMFIPLWCTICGLIPLGITIVFPIITAYYIKTRTISGNVQFKKAMLKLAFFLLIGFAMSFIGQVLPPLLLAILFRKGMNVDTPLVVYFAFILMNLSLIPTPVLILVYLGGVRKKLKEMLLCYCIRYRDDLSSMERSRTGSMTNSKRGSLHRQNTALSEIQT